MAPLAFLSSLNLMPLHPIRLHRCTCARPLPAMTGKGFGDKPEPESAPAATPKPLKPGEPSSAGAPFVPRGPTVRTEYERRGLIESELGPNSGVLPEVVAARMLRRILTFGGIPLSLLFAFFAAYFVLKYKFDITVIPVAVAYSTLGTIALATAGITYGIFSSSWDEDIEGSALGWKEATTNFLRAKDGLLGARERERRDDALEKLNATLNAKNEREE